MKRFYCMMAAAATLVCSIHSATFNSHPETQRKESTMESYYFPPEWELHEGTWLTWPHHYTYGTEYREEIENIWIQMASALHTDEQVHIIAYNKKEQKRITALLKQNGFNMEQIDFVIAKSDDVWSRDFGPMFVYDEHDKLVIANFAFDGWGEKTPYEKDEKIPEAVASAKKLPIVSIPDFVLEGGAVESDGAGTLMAAKSSVAGISRNPDITLSEAEAYLRRYLGVSNFIWLEGVSGEDITDAHIDGMARFLDDRTLLTVSEEDFYNLYEGIPQGDYDTLRHAENVNGQRYQIIELPMTMYNVPGLEYQGSYLNYYIGNKVVLVPVYGDENDALALDILAGLYEDRKIVPINVTALYQYGGMLHCITQQQPIS